MNLIVYTVICALVIAFILGVLLGLFKKIFHVDTDPKVEKVREALSGANCGGCGLAGCDAFAVWGVGDSDVLAFVVYSVVVGEGCGINCMGDDVKIGRAHV